MPAKPSESSARKPRADARRNRERILEAAHRAFTQSGANASLDDIAKEAGIGPGTLYRHFPTREALLEEVYRAEVRKLADAQQEFAETMSPAAALRAWMLLFVDHIATKKIIAPALNASVGGHPPVVEASYATIHEAMRALVRRAAKAREIRKDVDALDLLRALVGVAYLEAAPDWQASAKRLVEILIAGSRIVK